jgi:organic hydroperoxide reductase OsmC/OhrA
MAKDLYTAHAHVTGGRDGNAKTTECGLEIDLHVPKSDRGAGGGTNPEKVFAVRYAACLESALAVNPAARRHGLEQLQLQCIGERSVSGVAGQHGPFGARRAGDR